VKIKRALIVALLAAWLIGGWLGDTISARLDREALSVWSIASALIEDSLRDGYLNLEGENRGAWQVLSLVAGRPYTVSFTIDAQVGQDVEVSLWKDEKLAAWILPPAPLSGEGTVAVSEKEAIFSWAGKQQSATLDQWPAMIVFSSVASNLKLRHIRLTEADGTVVKEDNFRHGKRQSLVDRIGQTIAVALATLLLLWVDFFLRRRFEKWFAGSAGDSAAVVYVLIFIPALLPGPLSFGWAVAFLITAALLRYGLMPALIGGAEAQPNKKRKRGKLAVEILFVLWLILVSYYVSVIVLFGLALYLPLLLVARKRQWENFWLLLLPADVLTLAALLAGGDAQRWLLALTGLTLPAMALCRAWRGRKSKLPALAVLAAALLLLAATAELSAYLHPQTMRFEPLGQARHIDGHDTLFYLDAACLVQKGGPFSRKPYLVEQPFPRTLPADDLPLLLVMGGYNAVQAGDYDQAPSYVEQLADRFASCLRVVNDSHSRFDLLQKEIIFSECWRKTAPDILLIQVGAADSAPRFGLVRPTQLATQSPPTWQRSRALVGLYLRTARWRTGLLNRYGGGGIIDVRPPEDAAADLDRLLSASRLANPKAKAVVLFLDPGANAEITARLHGKRSAEIRPLIRAVAQRHNAVWLDADDLLQQDGQLPIVPGDPHHLTKQGSQQLADLVAVEIEKLLIPPAAD